MFRILSKIFIHGSPEEPKVRAAYGALSGVLGCVLNLLLTAGKLFAGIAAGSAAVIADAFNNLSDAVTSVVALAGFKLSAQSPDKGHPFGHGRYEYIAGLIVAMFTVMVGFELGKSSVEKIISPEEVTLSAPAAAVLIAAVFVKLYMAFYNSRLAAKIKSAALKSVARDSLADVAATGAVLLSLIIHEFTGANTDGICGLAVSLFVLRTGVSSARETIDLLVGKPPDKNFVKRLLDITFAAPEIIGVHGLRVHEYGAGRLFVTLHAEMSDETGFENSHEIIDALEERVSAELNCECVIHADPLTRKPEPGYNSSKDISEGFSEKESRHE